jgi:prevent-host-death family protein
MNTLVMANGQTANMHNVSQLQRSYPRLLEQVAEGQSVILQKNGEPVAVMLDLATYNRLVKADEKVNGVKGL